MLVRAVRVLEELTVDEADEATASLGVKGVFAGAGRVLASVGFSGRGLLRSVRSMGILQGGGATVWDGGGWCRGSSWPAGEGSNEREAGLRAVLTMVVDGCR